MNSSREASSKDPPAFTTVAAACFDHGTKEPEKNDKCGDQGGRDQAFQKKSVLSICKSPWWHLNLSPMVILEEVQHVVVMTLLNEVKLLPWMTSYISWTIHAIHAEYQVVGKQSRKAGEGAWFCYDVNVNLLICFAMKVATPKKNSSWSIQGSFLLHFKPLTHPSIPKPPGQFYSQKVQGKIQWDLCSISIS